jgi:hypothetical protein
MVQRLIVDEASYVCKVSVIGYVECRRIKNNNFGCRTRAAQCECMLFTTEEKIGG